MLFRYQLALVDSSVLQRKVTGARFAISRYGKYMAEISFPQEITVAEAIEEVEENLSQIASPRYYSDIKDDLFYEVLEHYQLDRNMMPMRGAFLGNCRRLERITFEAGMATLLCGS